MGYERNVTEVVQNAEWKHRIRNGSVIITIGFLVANNTSVTGFEKSRLAARHTFHNQTIDVRID